MRWFLWVWLVSVFGVVSARADEGPLRIAEAAGFPKWLTFGIEHRTRFEHLSNDFRAQTLGDAGRADAFFLRTLLATGLDLGVFRVGAELQDARAYALDDVQMNTTLVNAFELLRAEMGFRLKDLIQHGDQWSATAGRMTIDVGSRKLVARNGFRNTINGFMGLDLQWKDASGQGVRAFAVVPVVREPSEQAELAENTSAFDQENFDALLGCVFYEVPDVFAGIRLEVYALGFVEQDGDGAQSADRRFAMPAFRVLRTAAPGRVDFQAEVVGQFGVSRASAAPTDTQDIKHFALLGYVSAGYQWDVLLTPRLSLEYELATGDTSPDDEENNRFDPLFGGRRFDLNPTGIYGAFARSNISMPGVRVEVVPFAGLDAFVSYRPAWLASARDAWTTAGLRDKAGSSGLFIGHQIEGSARWQVFPKNLALEVGGALLIRDQFVEHVTGTDPAPTSFMYIQFTGIL